MNDTHSHHFVQLAIQQNRASRPLRAQRTYLWVRMNSGIPEVGARSRDACGRRHDGRFAWPTGEPKMQEAVLLADVRKGVAKIIGLDCGFLTPESVIKRYKELIQKDLVKQQKAERNAQREIENERKRQETS